MNKVYRVIWSHVKHCYIVVSELAKNHTKSCKIVVGGKKTAAALV